MILPSAFRAFEDVAIADSTQLPWQQVWPARVPSRWLHLLDLFATAYDQLIHDVALQDLDVLFALDRAGLVGEDGATHAGAYDISYLRCIPNMLVMTPSDENETRQLLYTGYLHQGRRQFAIRTGQAR